MEKQSFPEKQIWGTWEELLLACAVHRYGTESWDSVSAELRKRSATTLHHVLTPHSCKQKYLDLQRRFNQNNHLDELRKLRVAELKREVQRYDLSIVSLQLKVKELTEEHVQEDEKATEKSDLKIIVEDENEAKDAEPVNTSPENDAGEVAPCGDSDKESNSTDPKSEVPETGGEETEKEAEQGEPVGRGSGPVEEATRPVVEDSYNGSSDTVVKGSAAEEKGKLGGQSGELWESVSESKGGGGEEATKESNSDVQSSACNEDQSPATTKPSSVQSHPLIYFLDTLRSHCSDSFFECRLQTQETSNYMSLIRQHVDLKTIQTRLEEGCYSEYMSAIKLRRIVLNEMASKINLKPGPERKEEEKPVPSLPQCIKSDPEPSDSLLLKTKISIPLTACRKRSSITAKALASSSPGPDKKKEQMATLKDEKPVVELNQHDKSSEKTEENRVTKKRTRERSKINSRNSSKNRNRGRTNPNTNKNKNSDANSNSGFLIKGVSQNEISESRHEKEKKNATTTFNASAKKKSAANFLNRMKRNSSSPNCSSLLETLKSCDNSKGGAEQKKNGNGKGDLRREQTSSRKGSRGKQEKMQESPGKRNVGRPPKRAAVPSPALTAKRGRDAGETEAGSSRHSKKRSRK
ncbi:hypothetical protein CMV_019374 [Castanea mollissima]|uniref:Myb-like domain-containing protein n=1 Tax=Castanea mollissima TaxID=60419 RepID=A0A8J4QN61_9ROSI|nr:hypothetical protein CMV_019374 [Castanea mollissima]